LLAWLSFRPEDGGNRYLRNFGELVPEYVWPEKQWDMGTKKKKGLGRPRSRCRKQQCVPLLNEEYTRSTQPREEDEIKSIGRGNPLFDLFNDLLSTAEIIEHRVANINVLLQYIAKGRMSYAQ
jgi:hypothetical protein